MESEGILAPIQTVQGMHGNLLWKKQLLPNGLRVLSYPKPSSLTAQIAVAIEYGANDDPDEYSGAAHFLEHMVPGGSKQRIKTSREFERLGGVSDFFTNPEYTMSIVDVIPSKLVEAANNLLPLLFEGSFEEEQFRVERKIIFHELSEVADDPHEKVNEMLRQCLFRKHPMRRSVGGSKKTVRALSLPTLSDIYRRWYTPQNAIIILSGNFSEKDFDSMFHDFSWNRIKEAQRKERSSPEVDPQKRTISKKKAGLALTYLSMGARTTHSSNPDVAALDLLNVILGVGASSRLFIELREKRALTYSIGSSQTDGLDFGYLSIDCALKEKHYQKAERLILKQISRLQNETIPNSELTKGKDMILGDIFRGIDDGETRPEILAIMEMQFGSETALVDYVNRVKEVKADDVRDAANKYLQESQFATAVLSPKT